MSAQEHESRDPYEWPRLRRLLRTEIASRRVDRLAVAKALGLEYSAMVRVLGSDSAEPGIAVIQRAEAFLARHEEELSDDTRVPTPGDTGTHPPSGNGPAPSPHRLCEAERDRLLGYLELTLERQVRCELQMAVELAREAAAGAEIPPEAVQRITAFFEAAPGG